MNRVALIGLGAAARAIHLPALSAIDSAELCAACDPDDAARRTFSTLSPGVPLFDDIETLLSEQHPDWVLVATPPAYHRQSALAALAAGAHVFCEKPVGTGLSDLDAIMAAAKAAQRHVVVNFEFPHMPIFAAALKQPGTEAFGRALTVQAWQTVDEWPGSVSGWRAGGETLREFGCHVIDLTMRLFQERPHRVYARMPRPLGGTAGDLIDMLILDFTGDRCASIVIDRLCRGPHRYLEMRVDGEHASLRASIGGMARLTLQLEPRRRRPGARLELAGGGRLWLEKGETRRPLARNSMKAFHEATARHLEAALSTVTRGEHPQGTISQARPVLEVVEAAYTSARTGTAVSLS